MSSLSTDDLVSRAHMCISHKIYNKFRLDRSAGFGEDSETEQADLSSDDENGSTNSPRQSLHLNSSLPTGTSPNVPQWSTPLASTASTVPQQLAHSAAAITIDTATTTTSSALQRSHSLSMFSFIPSAIWKDLWTPQPGPYADFVSVASIADDMYAAATSGIFVEDLDVHVPSMSDLVKTFKTMLGDAAKDGDFTHILSPEHTFYMWVIKFVILSSVLKSTCLVYQPIILKILSLCGKVSNVK